MIPDGLAVDRTHKSPSNKFPLDDLSFLCSVKRDFPLASNTWLIMEFSCSRHVKNNNNNHPIFDFQLHHQQRDLRSERTNPRRFIRQNRSIFDELLMRRTVENVTRDSTKNRLFFRQNKMWKFEREGDKGAKI